MESIRSIQSCKSAMILWKLHIGVAPTLEHIKESFRRYDFWDRLGGQAFYG